MRPPGLLLWLIRTAFWSALVLVGVTFFNPAAAGRLSGICGGDSNMVHARPASAANPAFVCKSPTSSVELKPSELLGDLAMGSPFGAIVLATAALMGLRPRKIAQTAGASASSETTLSKADRRRAKAEAQKRAAEQLGVFEPTPVMRRERIDPSRSTLEDLDALTLSEVVVDLRAGRLDRGIGRIRSGLDCDLETAWRVASGVARQYDIDLAAARSRAQGGSSVEPESSDSGRKLSNRQIQRVRLLATLQRRAELGGAGALGLFSQRAARTEVSGVLAPTAAWEPPSLGGLSAGGSTTTVPGGGAQSNPSIDVFAPTSPIATSPSVLGSSVSSAPVPGGWGGASPSTQPFGGALGGAFGSTLGVANPVLGVGAPSAADEALPADKDAALRVLREWLVSGRLTFSEYERRREEVQNRG